MSQCKKLDEWNEIYIEKSQTKANTQLEKKMNLK